MEPELMELEPQFEELQEPWEQVSVLKDLEGRLPTSVTLASPRLKRFRLLRAAS
jgi:hypothetical protein